MVQSRQHFLLRLRPKKVIFGVREIERMRERERERESEININLKKHKISVESEKG